MIGWFSGLYCKVRTAWLRGMLSSSIQFLRDVINILQPRSFPRSASLCYGTLFFPLQFIAINWSGNKHGPKLTAGPSNSVSKRHVLGSWARPLLDKLQLKKNGTTPATQLEGFIGISGYLEEGTQNEKLFISCSSKDFSWVTENLIPPLEKHAIPYSIHSREFGLGRLGVW